MPECEELRLSLENHLSNEENKSEAQPTALWTICVDKIRLLFHGRAQSTSSSEEVEMKRPAWSEIPIFAIFFEYLHPKSSTNGKNCVSEDVAIVVDGPLTHTDPGKFTLDFALPVLRLLGRLAVVGCV